MTILIIAIIFWAYMRIILPEQKRRAALQEAAWCAQQKRQQQINQIQAYRTPRIIRETKTVNVAWNAKLGGYEPTSYSVITERI